MKLQALKDLPPWEWPAGAAEMLLEVLRDDRTSDADLLIAAELASDVTVIDDDLVEALLSIARSEDRPVPVRATAVISLGPVLEQSDLQGFEGLEDFADDLPIGESTFREIQSSLRNLYADASAPKEVRRRSLEASVRAPQDWHEGAIRAAYSSDDEEWRLTAVFGMGLVRGFDEQIRQALSSENEEIFHEAVVAAGNWAVDAAWPQVYRLLTSPETDKPLLIAAIEAAAGIRPHEAEEILLRLTESDDEDVVEAAYEAMAMLEPPLEDDDYED
jgi:hypothetical protein